MIQDPLTNGEVALVVTRIDVVAAGVAASSREDHENPRGRPL